MALTTLPCATALACDMLWWRTIGLRVEMDKHIMLSKISGSRVVRVSFRSCVASYSKFGCAYSENLVHTVAKI
jgi:hypothetical protein